MRKPLFMRLPGFAPTNLKFRLTCVVAALVLAVTMLVTLASLALVERDMKGVIGDQEYALLSSAAAFIDERMAVRQRQMAALAAAIPAAARDDSQALERFLHAQARTWSGEDYLNLVVFRRDGMLAASLHLLPNAGAVSIAARPFMQETLARKAGVVSQPLLSRLSGARIVVVTAPVLDARGEVALVLTASVDLQHSSFLRHIAALSPGKGGYLFLMTQDGILIDHPDKERLLRHIDATAGVNLGTRRALAGFEGWLEARGKDGRDAIYAYKRLPTTGWILAARYPTDEAFAPLIRLRQHAVFWAAGLALAAGALAWLLIHRLLGPLEALRSNVSAIRRDGADIDVLRTRGKDEIAQLAGAFHDLMAERERALARTRIIADNIPAMVAYVNSEERHEFTNAHCRDLLGVDPRSLMGKTIREAFGTRLYARLEPNIRAALRGERVRFEHTGWLRKRRVHHMIDYIPDLGGDGRAVGFYVMATDISERKRAELEQAASEQRLRLIADNLPVLIAYLDPRHRFRFGNATFERWFGVAPSRLVGMPLSLLIGDEAYARVLPTLEQAFAGRSASCEQRIGTGQGERIVESTYIPDVQPDGSIAGVYALTHDMTRMKEVEEKLTQLASTDSLTGLANRRMFGEALHHALERARRKGKALALAYLDIDRFKSINDSYGHGVGDEVLKEFARRLVLCVRASDTPARLSGDEFVIILEETGARQDAERIGAKIVEAIRAPFATSSGPLAVTASVGIALSQPGQQQEQLLAAADGALYAAKRNGRDRFALHEG